MESKAKFDQAVSLLRSAECQCSNILLKNAMNQLICVLSYHNEISSFDFSRYTSELELLHKFALDIAKTYALDGVPMSSDALVSSKYLRRVLAMRHLINASGFFYSFQPSHISSIAIYLRNIVRNSCCNLHSRTAQPESSQNDPCPTPAEIVSILPSVDSIYACIEKICAPTTQTTCPVTAIRKACAFQSFYPVQPPPSFALSSTLDIQRLTIVSSTVRSLLSRLQNSPDTKPQYDVLMKFFVKLLYYPFIRAENLPATLSSFLMYHSRAHAHFSSPLVSDHIIFPNDLGILSTVKSFRLPDNDQCTYARFRVAIYHIRCIHHPCVVTLHAAYLPRLYSEQNLAYAGFGFAHLITERMWNSLLNIFTSPIMSSEINRMKILWDTLSGLVALHSASICHASINARSVLLRAKHDRIYGYVKLDLPTISEAAFDHPDTNFIPVDVLAFQPPEGHRRNGGNHLTSDIWSFGILACLLFSHSGVNPFNKQTQTHILCNGPKSYAALLLQSIHDSNIRAAFERCFHENPDHRITSHELKNFLANYLKLPDRITNLGGAYRQAVPDVSVLDGNENGEYFLNFDGWHIERSLLKSQLNNAAPLPTQNVTNVCSVSPLTPQTPNQPAPKHYHCAQINDTQSVHPVTPHSPAALPLQRSAPSTKVPASTNQEVAPAPSIESLPRSAQGNLEHCLKKIAECGVAHAADQVLSTQTKIHPKQDAVSNIDRKEHDTIEPVDCPTTQPTSSNFIPPPAQSETTRSSTAKEEQTLVIDHRENGSNDEAKHMVIDHKPQHSPMKKPSLSGRRLKRRVVSYNSDDSNDDYPTSGLNDISVLKERSSPNSEINGQLEPRKNRLHRQSRARRVSYAESSSDEDDEKCPASRERADDRTACGDSRGNSLHVSYENVLMIPRQEGLRGQSSKDISAVQGTENSKNDFSAGHAHVGTARAGQKEPKKGRVGTGKARTNSLREERGGSLGKSRSLPVQSNYQEEGPHTSGWTEYQTALSLENGAKDSQKCEQIFHLYRMAAEAGCQTAKVRLAQCYEQGLGTAKDVFKAAILYKSAASLNNRDALFHAGRCYEEGIGLYENQSLAKDSYTKAVSFGHALAKMRLAKMYEVETPKSEGLSKAFHIYKSAAQDGHVEAKVKLAECYAKGRGVKRNIHRAADIYRAAADDGDPSAMFGMGLLHEDGSGVKKDTATAYNYYKKSAACNYGPGITALGQCYVWHFGVELNFIEAKRLFTKAANLGHGLAYYELGMLYKEGNGVVKDYRKAAEHFRIGVEKGCEVAFVQLGECLYHGRGVVKDHKAAFETFLKGAELGAQEGWRWLGDCYADGSGVEKDIKRAIDYYRKAARLGSVTALTCLASCYENGVGVAANMAKAVSLYRKAGDGGDLTALNNLGILHEKGKHVEKDYAKAVEYYIKAIERGNVEAMCNLADCYASGCGVPKDLEMAFKYYQDGANLGHAGSQCEMGLCYLNGNGVEKDTKSGLSLLHMAADREAEAARQLGQLYMEGELVQVNLKRAFEFFLSAAEKGNIDACYDVGNCYHHGHGIERDDKMAEKYYRKGADGGNNLARAALGNLFFNKEEFSEAFGLLATVASPQDAENAITLTRPANDS